MKNKVIIAVIAAAIIIGAGGAYAYHRESSNDTKVVKTALYNKKEVQNPNNTVILTKMENKKPIAQIIHNNKIVKIDGVNINNIRSFKNSNYFIGFGKTSTGVINCYLGNYDGTIKKLFKSNLGTQIIKVTDNYIYIQNGIDLIQVNLKDGTKKTLCSKYSGYDISAVSGDNLIYSGCGTNCEGTYYLYNTKTNKTINISNENKDFLNNKGIALSGEFTPVKGGFVITASGQKVYYYNLATGKITADTNSIIPKEFNKQKTSQMNGLSGLLKASFNKITYLYSENNVQYLITKEKDKEAKVVATLSDSDNYSRNYLKNYNMGTGSHKYFFYENSAGKMYSMNLDTDEKTEINSKNLNLSSTRFTANGDAYVLTTSVNATRIHEPMQMYDYPNSELYTVDSKTGATKLNSENICYFSLSNGNLTTLEYTRSQNDQSLKTKGAYNIYFNGKEIVKGAPFISNNDGSFLYQGSNGKLYTLYNGVSKEVDIASIYDYNGALQSYTDIGTEGLGIFGVNIDGYFKSTKDGITTYYDIERGNLTKIIDSKTPSYKVMQIATDINEEKGGMDSTMKVSPISIYKPITIHFDIVNYNEIKYDNQILNRVPASEYIVAQTSAIKAQGAKEMALKALFTNNIVTKKVVIDGKTYTKAYASNNQTIQGTFYVAENGFIYEYVNKPDGSKVLLPAYII